MAEDTEATLTSLQAGMAELRTTVAGLRAELDDLNRSVAESNAQLEAMADRLETAVLRVDGDARIAGDLDVQGVISGALATNSIVADQLAKDAVTEDKISAGAVTGNKIAASEVGTRELAANAVTGDKISARAVGTDQLADGAVSDRKLANAALSRIAIGTNEGRVADHRLDIQCQDLRIGQPGQPKNRPGLKFGRALTDFDGHLFLNFNNDWKTTRIFSLVELSSQRFKRDISDVPLQEAREFLGRLRPRCYRLRADDEQQLRWGFIAEETPLPCVTPDREAIYLPGILSALVAIVRDLERRLPVQEPHASSA